MPDDPIAPVPPPSDRGPTPRSPPSDEDATLDAFDSPTLTGNGSSTAKTVFAGELGAAAISVEQPAMNIGRYKLIKVLGNGGFGMVWQAEQTEPIRREVALKIIKPGMDSEEIIARFESERQALAMMDHPNIASVLDAGTTDAGRPYFVMELVKGVPITDYCDAQRFTIRQRLELFIPVCQAVQHAHQKAILHRDLKPSNILVTEVDEKPVPKVIDFGIAKALGAAPAAVIRASLAITREGMIIGTPQYMSPEQAGSVSDVDTRSDVYALGVILHQLITGQTPLGREQLRNVAFHEVLRLIRESDPVRPSNRIAPETGDVGQASTLRGIEPAKLARALRGDLDWITLKALEKERERRYESAVALAQDLERHLRNEPVNAGPPTVSYRLRKFVRRQRRALAFSGVIFVCLVGGLAFGVASLLSERAALAVAAQRGKDAEIALGLSRKTLSNSLFFRAQELWAGNQLPQAVAYLTQALRADPANKPARTFLISLLVHRSWPVPLISASPDTDRLMVRSSPPKAEDAGMRFRVSGRVDEAHLSANGAFIATLARDGGAASDAPAPSDGTGQTWDARTGAQLHSLGKVNFVRFLSNGSKVLTSSSNGTVQIRDTPTGQSAGAPLNHQSALEISALSNDETHCLVKTSDRLVLLCRLTDKAVQPQSLTFDEDVSPAGFNPDGSRFLVMSERKVFVCSTLSCQILFVLERGTDNATRSAVFSPDGRRILTRSHANAAQLWDASTGRLICTLERGNYAGADGAAFSPDGALLATLDYKASGLQIWNSETGALLCTTPEDGVESAGSRLGNLRFRPTGEHVVAVGFNYRSIEVGVENFARLWDVSTAQVFSDPLVHQAPLTDVQFSNDGSLVATASEDGIVQVWDVRTGKPVAEPFLHPAPVISACLSENGKVLLTCSGDSAYLWRLPYGANPLPEWFLKFSEKLCGYRLTEGTALVRTDRQIATQEQLKELILGPEVAFRSLAVWLLEERWKGGTYPDLLP